MMITITLLSNFDVLNIEKKWIDFYLESKLEQFLLQMRI